MQELIDLALTLEIIDPVQAQKLSAIAQYVKDKDDDLATCKVDLAHLQTLVDVRSLMLP